MKKRCCIIGAGPITDYARVSSYIREDDFFIYCDGGLYHREALGVTPDLIIGDFDSYPKEDFPEETIVLPHVKDDTDSFFAVKEGFSRGFRDFLLLGFAGGRLDHTLGNISTMIWLNNHGAHALLLDDYSEMEVIENTTATISPDFAYFSLVNLEKSASGISIRDAFYELDDGDLTNDIPLGISNEPLAGKTAKVTVKEGALLLIRIFDS